MDFKINITDIDMKMYYIMQRLKSESRCIDKQVVCLLLDADYKIVSVGVNEILTCDKNCHNKEKRVCQVIHAEVMAYKNLNKEIDCEYAYLSLFPCVPCQKTLRKLNLKEVVVFGKKHKDQILDNIKLVPDLYDKVFKDNNLKIFACGEYFDSTVPELKIKKHKQGLIDTVISMEMLVEKILTLLWTADPEIFNEIRYLRAKKYIAGITRYSQIEN